MFLSLYISAGFSANKVIGPRSFDQEITASLKARAILELQGQLIYTVLDTSKKPFRTYARSLVLLRNNEPSSTRSIRNH